MSSTLLTDSKIRGLKPKKPAYYIWQACATRGTGRLAIKIYPSGRKTFVYRYFLPSKEKFVTLGDFPALSLAQATSKVLEIKAELSVNKKITLQLASLKKLFDDYIADQKNEANGLI